MSSTGSMAPLSSAPTFADLGVPDALCSVLARQGITVPTPIQAATLADSIGGRDLLGRGRTGSGKTYAFLLPVLARLAASGRRARPKLPRALVLVPTRELATQIDAALRPLAVAAGLRSVTVFGGVSQHPQAKAIQSGVDVVIACPGRLEDLIRQGLCRLDRIEVTVLDEADHMSDLGFLPGVHRILGQTPAGSQRLLFSATLDSAVNAIVTRHLHDPVTHEADSPQSPIATMTHHVLHLHRDNRVPVLVRLTNTTERSLVFTRTKHGAKALARRLNDRGVASVELHGNLAQGARDRNLAAFHSGAATTLVATDIAARGIHVDDVALVIHADPPVEHKAYLHRSGRTARNGAAGTVITLMHDDQVSAVRSLTRAAGVTPTTTRVDERHPLMDTLAPLGQRVGRPATSARSNDEPQRSGTGLTTGTSRTTGTVRGTAPAATTDRGASRPVGHRGGRGRRSSAAQTSGRRSAR